MLPRPSFLALMVAPSAQANMARAISGMVMSLQAASRCLMK